MYVKSGGGVQVRQFASQAKENCGFTTGAAGKFLSLNERYFARKAMFGMPDSINTASRHNSTRLPNASIDSDYIPCHDASRGTWESAYSRSTPPAFLDECAILRCH